MTFDFTSLSEKKDYDEIPAGSSRRR